MNCYKVWDLNRSDGNEKEAWNTNNLFDDSVRTYECESVFCTYNL